MAAASGDLGWGTGFTEEGSSCSADDMLTIRVLKSQQLRLGMHPSILAGDAHITPGKG